MKKTINITLSSIVFAIEEDAYISLEQYLTAIQARLSESADQSEIMSDIEAAMAEKLRTRGRSERIAVNMHDVEQLQSEMGAPAAFDDGSEEVIDSETRVDSADDTPRRLFRDTDDAVLAGVAAGIARYFGIDPVIVRIVFVVSVFLNGVGILAYIILWLVVPRAKTTTDKLAMQGKRATVEDITARVKKNLNDADLVDTAQVKNAWHKARTVLERCFGLFGQIAKKLIVVGRYVFGVVFVIGGALGAAGLVSMYSVVLLSEKTFLPSEAQTALDIMFSNALGVLAIGASFVMMLIPLLVLIMLGASLLKKQNVITANKGIALAVVWIVALVLAGTTSALQVEKVWQEIGPQLEGDEIDIVISEEGMYIVSSSSETF